MRDLSMPSLALLTGIVLIAIGVISYAITAGASATALIPALLGVVIGAAALIANRKPELRRHLMHGAMAIALLGALGSLRGFGMLPSVAGIAQVATVIVCAAFLAMGVRSFIEARKSSG
jgi:hypothetical protein